MNDTIIYEYKTVKCEKLTKHIIDDKSLHQYFKQDWGKVKARQYCGIINYDNTDYYVLPKIATNENAKDINLNIFIYMLIYSHDIKVHNEDLSNALNIQSNNVLEVFIQMFAKNLFAQFQRGTYKEYITEQDNLATLRGKYLINENLKHNFTNSKIYCEYDEFSENNELNQFFLYAVKILMKYTKNKKLLKQCELVLNEVTYRHFDISNLDIHFNRLNHRYKESFEFALLLLKKSIPSFSKDKKGFAFLFDMDILFELFIGKLIKNIEPTSLIESKRLFGDLLLNPDIIIPNKLIVDIKYKIPKSSRDIKAADRHQIYVYGNNFNIQNTMLLYPNTKYKKIDNIVLGNNAKKINLLIKYIDLYMTSKMEYVEFINDKKEKLIKILGVNNNE